MIPAKASGNQRMEFDFIDLSLATTLDIGYWLAGLCLVPP
jgi:hypothetical protein